MDLDVIVMKGYSTHQISITRVLASDEIMCKDGDSIVEGSETSSEDTVRVI